MATTDDSKRAAEGGDRQAGGWGADHAYHAGPARLRADSVVSGCEARHAVPAWHDMTNQLCLVMSCLIVSCLFGLGSGHTEPAHLVIYR